MVWRITTYVIVILGDEIAGRGATDGMDRISSREVPKVSKLVLQKSITKMSERRADDSSGSGACSAQKTESFAIKIIANGQNPAEIRARAEK